MFKLCIALGWSVIRMQLVSAFEVEYIWIWEKIKQHRIVLSESIENYYKEKAINEGLLEAYECFMSSIQYCDCYIAIKDKYKEFDRNLNDYLKNRCKCLSIVIMDKKEMNISKSACRYQYTVKEVCENKTNMLLMYSVPSLFYVEKGGNAKMILDWIKNLISEETDISIIDRYILNNSRNYNCFTQYYFPIFPKNCLVHLFVPKDSGYVEKLYLDSNEWNFNVDIREISDMQHERHIVTSNRIINIGLGLDFAYIEQGKVKMRNGSNFGLREKDKGFRYLELEERLAKGSS